MSSDKIVILLPLIAIVLLALLGIAERRVWKGFNPPDFTTFKVFKPQLTGESNRVTVTINRVTVQPEWEAKARTYPTGRQSPLGRGTGNPAMPPLGLSPAPPREFTPLSSHCAAFTRP